MSDAIDESSQDDQDHILNVELENEVAKANDCKAADSSSHSSDSGSNVKDFDQSDAEDSSDYSDDSDCDSERSVYQLTQARKPFVSLNIMILMEYVEGETLRDIIDSSPEYLTRQMIFNLFTQLMTALKKIHSNYLVHRDIKPENIFVNRKTNRL